MSDTDPRMEIPPEIRKCVVFLEYHSKRFDEIRFAGTGYFITVEDEPSGTHAVYLVTARHVVDAVRKHSTDQVVRVRINTESGIADPSPTIPCDKWTSPSDRAVDVAIVSWTPDEKQYDYRAFRAGMGLNPSTMRALQVSEGDEVFVTGLFSNHAGRRRNLPIIRTGTIALLPEEHVHTRLGDTPAFLIEARSIGGLSGSPVFVAVRQVSMRMREMSDHGGMFGGEVWYYWLGHIHGHWDEYAGQEDSAVVDASTDERRVNMGIAIVTPAFYVFGMLREEPFVSERKKLADKAKERKLPTMDSAEPDQAKRGRKADALKLDGPWEDRVKDSFAARKPPKKSA